MSHGREQEYDQLDRPRPDGDEATRSGRYPCYLPLSTDERQRDDVEGFAKAINRSRSEVMRQAIAAGLPILRQRAEQDGTLVA